MNVDLVYYSFAAARKPSTGFRIQLLSAGIDWSGEMIRNVEG
jgi:hypothetical protein